MGLAFTDSKPAGQAVPHRPEDYYRRAGARLDEGDWEGALAALDQALALEPDGAEAYHARGDVRFARGDTAGALADYDRALALAPRYCAAYLSRARARYHQRDPRAAADYEAAFRLDAARATDALVVSVLYRAWARADAALNTCDQRLQADPDDLLALVRRGLTLVLLGRDAEALPDFDRVRRLDPVWEPYLGLLTEAVRRHRTP